MKSNRRYLYAGGAALIVLVALSAFVWNQFFRDDAPPPVSLEAAIAEVADSTSTGVEIEDETATVEATNEATKAPDESADATTEPEATDQTVNQSSDLSGQWTLSTDSESFVGYRIGEELARIGTTEAVGRTTVLDGTATVDGSSLTDVSVTADMTSLQSDEDRRDRALERQSLETATYTSATFELTSPIELPAGLSEGGTVSLTIAGDLTLHGVTQSIEMPVDAQLNQGVLVVVGSLDIQLSDYQIQKPSSPSVLSVDDHGVLELQLFFVQA